MVVRQVVAHRRLRAADHLAAECRLLAVERRLLAVERHRHQADLLATAGPADRPANHLAARVVTVAPAKSAQYPRHPGKAAAAI